MLMASSNFISASSITAVVNRGETWLSLHLPPFLDSLPGSLPLRRLHYQSTQKYLPETGLRLLLGHFRAEKTMNIALITNFKAKQSHRRV